LLGVCAIANGDAVLLLLSIQTNLIMSNHHSPPSMSGSGIWQAGVPATWTFNSGE
jgi:hypothetical protein